MLKSKATQLMGLGAVLALSASMVACASNADTQGLNGEKPAEMIKFEWGVPTSSYLALYVAQDQGYFADEGLDPNFQYFQSGAPMLPALQSESLDVATSGLATLFALGLGIDIKYIAFEGDASAVEGLIALPDGPVQKLEDIGNGSPIGVPTGSCAQLSAYFAAQSVGIDYSDINVVDITPNLYGNAFETRSIEAGFSWSPFIVQLEQAGNNLIGYETAWVPGGGTCAETHVARGKFLESNPEVGAGIVRALDRAWTAIREDQSIAVKALMERLEVDESTAEVVVAKYVAAQPTLEDLIDPENGYAMVGDEGLVKKLKIVADAFTELGVLEETLSVEQIGAAVDPSFIEEAVAAK